jgi:hypothetical protein
LAIAKGQESKLSGFKYRKNLPLRFPNFSRSGMHHYRKKPLFWWGTTGSLNPYSNTTPDNPIVGLSRTALARNAGSQREPRP